MAPAFSSTREAGWFAVLLAGLLLLPLALPEGALGSREEMYASYWWGSGVYPYIEDQIYHHADPSIFSSWVRPTSTRPSIRPTCSKS
jgi:hypothetical protein